MCAYSGAQPTPIVVRAFNLLTFLTLSELGLVATAARGGYEISGMGQHVLEREKKADTK